MARDPFGPEDRVKPTHNELDVPEGGRVGVAPAAHGGQGASRIVGDPNRWPGWVPGHARAGDMRGEKEEPEAKDRVDRGMRMRGLREETQAGEHPLAGISQRDRAAED
jgi:hypothetical protein